MLYAQSATTVISGRKVYVIIKYTCDLDTFCFFSFSPPPPSFLLLLFIFVLFLFFFLFFFFFPVQHALVSGEKEITGWVSFGRERQALRPLFVLCSFSQSHFIACCSGAAGFGQLLVRYTVGTPVVSPRPLYAVITVAE